MHFKSHVLILCAALTLSCVSKRKASDAPSTPNNASGVTVADVVNGSLVGLDQQPDALELMAEAQKISEQFDKRGWNSAVELACSYGEENVFCRAMSAPVFRPASTKTPTDRKFSMREMKSILVKGSLEQVDTDNVLTIIKASQSLSKSNLYAAARKAQSSEACLSPTLLIGLGAAMEEHFPTPEAVELTNAVYKKSADCGVDESAGKAAYRFGLLQIWLEKPELSKGPLDMVLKNEKTKYLGARAFYWKTRFQDPAVKEEGFDPSLFYQQYPLSFHSISWTADNARSPASEAFKNAEPVILYRSEIQKDLNIPLIAAEAFLKVDAKRLAKLTLDRFPIDPLHQTETGFRIYTATLFSRLKMAHATFRSLAPLFSQVPQVKTRTTLNMYYPYSYLEETREFTKTTDLDPFLILSLIRQESGFNPETQSPKGARGLMQLMPLTAKRVKKGVTKKDLFNPAVNLEVGIRFFNSMVKRYEGNVPLALAAYNAGPLAVDKWLKRYPTQDSMLFLDLIPYRETREYVSSILRNWYWYRNLYDPENASMPIKLTSR